MRDVGPRQEVSSETRQTLLEQKNIISASAYKTDWFDAHSFDAYVFGYVHETVWTPTWMTRAVHLKAVSNFLRSSVDELPRCHLGGSRLNADGGCHVVCH